MSGDVVVLCASAIESVRLLLNSGSSHHGSGLANSNGLVGRYLMEQSMTLGFGDDARRPGYFEPSSQCEPDPFYGNSGGFLIPRYQNLTGQTEAYRRGYSFQGLAGRVPVPEDCPAMFGFGAGGEMLPRYDNRVALSRRVKDRWGIPAAHIVCRPDDNDRIMVRAAVRDINEMMRAGGYRTNFVASTFGVHSKKVWPDFNPVQRAVFRVGIRMSLVMGVSIHEAGGARMGHDPAASVLNGVCQAWDVPNLFVTDAASFPTGSTEGPALFPLRAARSTRSGGPGPTPRCRGPRPRRGGTVSDFDWSETDINVLYDVFYEQGTILAAEYISLSYQAEDAGDRDGAAFWSEQVRQVDRERSDVDPDDRSAMIETMKRWQRTREQIQRLRALAPAAA